MGPEEVVHYRTSYFKSMLLDDGTIQTDDKEIAGNSGSN